MNRNSLENFRLEAQGLKIPKDMVVAAEALMEKGVEKIDLLGWVSADKGTMDLSIHLKKSGQSDYYYLNRFEVAMSSAKPLEAGHQYLISGPDRNGEVQVKRLDSPVQALEYFKSRESDFELARGKFSEKDIAFKDVLATMKDGKVDYVARDFRTTFYSPILRNSHYLDRGKGFTVEQAANMLQGRAVFREDLVSRAGVSYKAWSMYQLDQAKDRYGNYGMRQYGEGYGFDLKKELAAYPIKELGSKQSLEKLITEMQNGNRPVVSLVGAGGEERQLRVEAVPRYTNLNFFELDGRVVKREALVMEQGMDKALVMEKGKGIDKGKDKSEGLSI